MSLDEWRTLQGLSYSALGRRIGVSSVHARALCRGEHIPRPKLARRIKAETNEAVREQDLWSAATQHGVDGRDSEEAA